VKRSKPRNQATARRAIPRTGSVTHALVIGVSQYDHFRGGDAESQLGRQWGMQQLSCGASSAAEFANWLATEYDANNRQTPLESLRVLLSPSRDENVPPLHRGSYQPATRANVEEALAGFVDDCERSTDNVAFVYIAGHGVQLTSDGAIVLLADAGGPFDRTRPLRGAIDAGACHAGMNHPGAPATQFWFVDACRQRPDLVEKFETMTGALTLPRLRGATKVSPLFLAASNDQVAWSQVGKRTVFCEALLEALRHSAATGPDGSCSDWHVSTDRLHERLTVRVKEIARAYGVDQDVDATGKWGRAVVHRLPGPPRVHLQVNLSPNRAAGHTSASLWRRRLEPPVASTREIWPFVTDVNAGLYFLDVTVNSPFNRVQEEIVNALTPPAAVHNVEVG